MNVVVICCDTFRHDMFNHPVVKTPNLNRLAAEGIVFANAFAEGLPTIEARRTMFTGVRSFPWRFEMGSRGLTPALPGWHRIPDEQITLAEHLWEMGVITGLVGDTYHMFKPTQNFTRGFCSWNFIRGQEADPVRSGPLAAVDVSPYHPEGVNDHNAWPSLTQYLLNMLDRHEEKDYLPARVFRAAATWLEDNQQNDPWMLWIDSFAPHERWDPPQEFADDYYTAELSGDYIQPQLLMRKGASITEDEIRRTRALYCGYVTFVDKWIGHFLDKLAALGKLDDTAVIFTSDHGTELMDRGRFGKGGDRLYRYNAGIPLIVRPPGSREGGTVRKDFAQHQDLLPTICALMGYETPEDAELDGRDLLDGTSPEPEAVITAWYSHVAVRSHQWSLMLNAAEPNALTELYDLTADPDEKVDVLAANAAPAAELKAFLEKTLGPLPYEIAHHGDGRQAPPLTSLAMLNRKRRAEGGRA